MEACSVKNRNEYLRILAVILLLTAGEYLLCRMGQSTLKEVHAGWDKRHYFAVAKDLFDGGAFTEFQYPFVYPVFIWLTGQTERGLLLSQVLVKAFSLAVIWLLLRKKMPEREGMTVMVLLALSPLWCIFSFRYMAENLEVPLLLITLLLHFGRRENLAGSGHFLRKLLLTVLAAGMAWTLMMTKYMCLLLLPVFCLLWGTAAFQKKEKRWLSALFWCAVYTSVVLLLIVYYAHLVAQSQGAALNLAVIKKTIGFSQASGPDRVGYRFIPEARWLLCYGLYAFTGAAMILVSLLAGASRKRILENPCVCAGIGAIALILIYVSARHSTLAPYNVDGYMDRLLGRYVAPVTTLGVMLPYFTLPGAVPASEAAPSRGSLLRSISAAAAGCAVVLGAWAVLYRNCLGFNMSKKFVLENRGFDLLAFSRIGFPAVCVYLVLILLNAFVKKKQVLYLSLAACFLMNDFSLLIR